MSPAASPTARRSAKAIRSLLDIENLPAETIAALLKLARRMQGGKTRPVLRGKTVALLYYEASTRTRVSFGLAAKKLGGMTTLVTAAASSIQKGVSLLDTVYTLRAAGADAIVMRHPSSGAPHLAARNLDIPVINAGDGMHEHPTQALLDAFTMLRHKKNLRGLRVSIIGDILHSRVARSNAHLLSKFGAQITFCGPPELAPDVCATLANGIRLTRHMEDALRGADGAMMAKSEGRSLLIRGGRVIDPAQRLDAERDLLLRDGRVSQIAERGKIRGSADETFDARGLVVTPGFIDLHVHLREPGQAHKESIASGTAAAAAGGFTS